MLSEDFPALTGFRAGVLLAGYRLEAQVGAGGMAVVFRARDERLGRVVALKILAPALASDGAFRRRFIAESRAAAAVDDPHIIPVHEAGEADGVLFIAMRFVPGGDLRRVLEREGALPADRTAEFISPVASALDAAHAAGLVHRDVKPANILVDARPGRPDHVYLSDFGVVKGVSSSVSLTAAGQFLGTPNYSAPEQIQGLAVDGRADQYALACVTYQLLTGALPFERDQDMAVLLAHVSAPPPSLGAGLPEAADRVLARALAKVPEKRYGSCQDFADALREALGLAPYISVSPAPVAAHPQPEVASSVAAGAGPADPETAVTIDSALGGGLVGVDVPPPAVMIPSQPTGPPETSRPPETSGPPETTGELGRLTAEPGGTIPPWAQPRHRSSGRRRWPIVTAALGVLVAVLLGGGFIFWNSSQHQYYVAADSNGEVVLYRGINQHVLGLSLSSPYQATGIQLDQVPSNYQQAVQTATSTGSLAQAQTTVASVRTAVNECLTAYTAQKRWVTKDNVYKVYQAKVARAKRERIISNLGPAPPNPGPPPLGEGQHPSSTGGLCPPSEVYGIPASALTPAASGST